MTKESNKDQKYQAPDWVPESDREEFEQTLKELERDGMIQYFEGGWYPGPNHPNKPN